jgi:hypothetical protein
MVGNTRVAMAGLLFALSAGKLAAQAPVDLHQANPTESVTVTAPSQVPDTVLHDFIANYTASSQPSGKVARWRIGACPITTGLPAAANHLVTDRVRDVGRLVGAPVGDAACKPNIDIVFTLNPQVLLDEVRKKERLYLGIHAAGQADGVATVTHPVQAWYTTQTVDQTGNAYLDRDQSLSAGYVVGSAGGPVTMSDVPAVHVTGSRIHDELSSELFHVIVVIDLSKVNGRTLGSLSDYVAMLSLARTKAFDVCQPVASITNLFAVSCGEGRAADKISDNDLAYLHGIYSIDPRTSFRQQKDEIAYQMKKGVTLH